MKKPVFLILFNSVIVVGVFFLLLQSLVVVQRVAQVTVGSGHAEVQRNGSGPFTALKVNDVVRAGDVLRTDTDSTAELSWADGSRCKLMSNSELVVLRALYNSVSHAEDTHLALPFGQLYVRMVHDAVRFAHFAIQTPYIVANVQPGVFRVQADPGDHRVLVYHGTSIVQGLDSQNDLELGPGTQGGLSDSDGKLWSSPANTSAFHDEPTISLPPVDVFVDVDGSHPCEGTLEIQTEWQASVTVDGKAAVRDKDSGREGIWTQPVHVGPHLNIWHIASTDQYGSVHQVTESYQSDPGTAPAAH